MLTPKILDLGEMEEILFFHQSLLLVVAVVGHLKVNKGDQVVQVAEVVVGVVILLEVQEQQIKVMLVVVEQTLLRVVLQVVEAEALEL